MPKLGKQNQTDQKTPLSVKKKSQPFSHPSKENQIKTKDGTPKNFRGKELLGMDSRLIRN